MLNLPYYFIGSIPPGLAVAPSTEDVEMEDATMEDPQEPLVPHDLGPTVPDCYIVVGGFFNNYVKVGGSWFNREGKRIVTGYMLDIEETVHTNR